MGALLLRDADAGHDYGFDDGDGLSSEPESTSPCLPAALADLAISSLDTPPATPGLTLSSPPSPASSSLPSTAAAAAAAPQFHSFTTLPTELRLKIWRASFLPRVVEIHRPKLHYADTNAASYQSWSANPAALSVCFEARACALSHYTTFIRLVVNTRPGPVRGVHRDLFRRLYISPQTDTIAVLGDFDVIHTQHLLKKLRSADEQDSSHIKLAISASSIDQASMLHIYGRTVLKNVEQITLFLYDQRVPPAAWRDGHCALVDCRGTYQYRRFLAKQAADLRVPRQNGHTDDEEQWITIGQRPLLVRDLVFGADAKLRDEASSAMTAGRYHIPRYFF